VKKGRRNANHAQGEKAKRRRMPRYTWRPREGEKSALRVMRQGFVRNAEMRECAKLQHCFRLPIQPTSCVHMTKKPQVLFILARYFTNSYRKYATTNALYIRQKITTI